MVFCTSLLGLVWFIRTGASDGHPVSFSHVSGRCLQCSRRRRLFVEVRDRLAAQSLKLKALSVLTDENALFSVFRELVSYIN